jgi:hypothetical protein
LNSASLLDYGAQHSKTPHRSSFLGFKGTKVNAFVGPTLSAIESNRFLGLESDLVGAKVTV